MMKFDEQSTRQLFMWVTAHPRSLLIIALLLVVATASGLSRMVKDTSVKAFIPPDHPSLIADDLASEIFGLTDSLAVAMVVTGDGSVFEPGILEAIAELTGRIQAMPNIRPERVASLATESSIRGEAGVLHVDPYIDEDPVDAAAAADTRSRWEAMPPHQDSLVSRDGRAALIMAELVDPDEASDTYEAALAMAAEYATPELQIHVAGPGAVSGFLSTYIDRDARKMQPLVFAMVLGFIYLAFRRGSALPGPLLVVVGAAGGAMGIMAWTDTPYYAITNALPVVVVAVSVADAIHILSSYYQQKALKPHAATREIVVQAMTAMARPITLTTLTTMAGFIGIASMSIMPPITMFGWFAALGVSLAWLFSMFALPNVLMLVAPGPSPAFTSWEHNEPSGVGRFLAHIGAFSARNYLLVLGLFALATALAVTGALQLRIDRSQVDNFAPEEPIRVADQLINDTFAGSAFLDIIVQTDEPEGLLSARRMAKIAELQRHMEQLPYVQKTVAITDYLALLHYALEELPADTIAERPLPDSDNAISQYLLVYESSGNPTDFEEEIDIDYQTAMIRGVLNEQYFSKNRETVIALENYIRTEFNEPGMRALLAGDVNIGYHWMSNLKISHFSGVALSLLLVLLTSIIVFRSVGSGIVAVLPVTFTVLMLYATMATLDVYLEPATSMFAAIAIGVGVDFAIHLIDKLHEALALHDEDIHLAVDHALPLTARACYYNSVALAVGFSVLMVSDLPMLQRFGGLVTLAALCSYITALAIVPAMFAAGRALNAHLFRPTPGVASRTAVAAVLLGAGLLYAGISEGSTDNALQIARQVAERPEGEASRRLIDITLTDRRGKSRERSALVLKLNDEEARTNRFTYLAPKSVYEVTFLSRDFREEGRSDDRWLYLPATRKVRRIPTTDRGDYFLGTDFTYEDIQSEFKLSLADYNFATDGSEIIDGIEHHRLSGEPKSEAIARELGYGGFEALVNVETWLFREVKFYDRKRAPLKTVTINAASEFDGIWSATDIEAVNHQTNHRTRFIYREVEYPETLPPEAFDAAALSRGLPPSLLP